MKKIIKKFIKEKSNNPNKIAKREQTIYAIILLMICMVSYAFYVKKTHKVEVTSTKENTKLDGSFDKVFNQLSDEALIEKQQDEIDSLKDKVLMNEKKINMREEKEKENNSKDVILEMNKKIAKLEQDYQQTKDALAMALLQSQEKKQMNLDEKKINEINNKNSIQLERALLLKSGLETVQFKSSDTAMRTEKNYVWAGTFVTGVLLTGLIGDAGINGEKNMGTAMIRLTSRGIMPNNKQSNLEGCFALASSYGDLSSDTVVLHLETLSCAGDNINFEQKVYGSVFDLDAMQDLRGTSVLKAKPLLSYSAAAGILSGLGDGLKNAGTLQTVTPGTGTVTTYNSARTILQSAAGQGMTNPANKISEYIMKIAEIYHPIVLAKGGRKVSIMFTKGFWIDKAHQENGDKSQNANEKHAESTMTSVSHSEGNTAFNDNENTNKVNMPSDLVPLSELNTNKNAEKIFLEQNAPTQPPLFSPVQGN